MPERPQILPPRSLAPRVVAASLVAVLLVGVGGWLWLLVRLGSDTAATVARIEADLRREFQERAATLQAVTRRVLEAPVVAESLRGSDAEVRALFDLVAAATDGTSTDVSLTVSTLDGQAVAWAGRPQGVESSRLAGGTALFLGPGALGLNLVYVEPVYASPAGGPKATAVGAVVAEYNISPRSGVEQPGVFPAPFRTRLVTVQLMPGYASGTYGTTGMHVVVIDDLDGEPLVEAAISPDDVLQLRTDAWRQVVALMGLTAGTGALLLAGVLGWERRRVAPAYPVTTLLALLAIAVARGIWWASLPSLVAGGAVTSPDYYASAAWPAFHRSPADLAATAVCALSVVALLVDVVRRLRILLRRHRPWAEATRQWHLTYVAIQLLAGAAATGLLRLVLGLITDTVGEGRTDLLTLAIQSGYAPRLTVQLGLFGIAAALFWAQVLLLRTALLGWHRGRPATWRWRVETLGAWLLPTVLWQTGSWLGDREQPELALVGWMAAAGVAALVASRGIAWFRHGTQGRRLATVYAALLLPTLLTYPLLLDAVVRAKRHLVATQYAVEALNHPQELQNRLARALEQIDAMPGLAEIIASAPRTAGSVQTDTALTIWRQTELAAYRLTSAVEIYAPDGPLVSRFALNFPEYEATLAQWRGTACTWNVFGEALAFGSEERPMLHAERAVCEDDRRTGRTHVRGGLIVHVMLDYSSLPFLSTQGPYFDLFRGREPAAPGPTPQRDVDLVLYGWGRSAIYSSAGRVWPLPDEVFDRAYESREAFWATQWRGDRLYDIHVSNDRLALYVVGFPRTTPLGHLVHLAELATLGGIGTVLLLVGVSVLHWVNRRGPQPGTLLVREIRASFTRKLFLAFVATSVIPVLTLAVLVRTFVAQRLRADVEAEATRTASVAQRVIEETLALQQPGVVSVAALTDDVMVWISRVISQDINIFLGSTLRATSQRDLFQSGLLPERTPDSVYRAIVLQRLPSVVAEDQIGWLRYRLAAAPIRVGGRDAILTVPMTLRQQEIDNEIAELDRGVNLGVVVFILLGAFLGYSIASRIGDPVQRLTAASRRIAAGDLDQRVVARTADELQRLVEAFNSMAAELSRQRAQLERTHRLEAWAEMARQVAHDIKNPLTPIQLSAEHLRRVHKDRGEPLSPVLEGCIDTILLQVRVLRQIASEFASFASTPTARPAVLPLRPIVDEVVDAYSTGLPDRIQVTRHIADDLPLVRVDRVLLGRAMTNIIENALHAMPSGGTLSVEVTPEGDEYVAIAIRDTGVGMDDEALARLFEPYFSTKATGTGLGLSIARRNIELMGGSIEVRSARGHGTTVILRVPTARPLDDGSGQSG
jgi:signal transduction histidine kinase